MRCWERSKGYDVCLGKCSRMGRNDFPVLQVHDMKGVYCWSEHLFHQHGCRRIEITVVFIGQAALIPNSVSLLSPVGKSALSAFTPGESLTDRNTGSTRMFHRQTKTDQVHNFREHHFRHSFFPSLHQETQCRYYEKMRERPTYPVSPVTRVVTVGF